MKRWFVIFMLVLLPVQWVYAAGCSFCHIPGASNETKHVHESGKSDQTTQQFVGEPPDGVTDCQTCAALSLSLPAWPAETLLGSASKSPLTGTPILPLVSATPHTWDRVPIL